MLRGVDAGESVARGCVLSSQAVVLVRALCVFSKICSR